MNKIPSPKIEIVVDKSPLLARYIYQRLNLELDDNQVLFSLGFIYQKKLIGGLVWTDFRKNHDVWWTIDTWDKNWCTKKVLNTLFYLAKEVFHLKHINAMTKTKNQKAIHFLTRLGFEKTGHLNEFYLDDNDAYLFQKSLQKSTGFL